MKLFGKAVLMFVVTLISVISVLPKESGPYLGQKPPGVTPEIFAHGIVSTKNFDEYGCTFSPDGKEFYFSRRKGPYVVNILVSRQSVHGWTTPAEVSFASEGFPSLSYDGKYIFFDRNEDIYWVNAKIIQDLKSK